MKKLTCQCGSHITDVTYTNIPEETGAYSSCKASCSDCGATYVSYKEGHWKDETEAHNFMQKRIQETFFDRVAKQ